VVLLDRLENPEDRLAPSKAVARLRALSALGWRVTPPREDAARRSNRKPKGTASPYDGGCHTVAGLDEADVPLANDPLWGIGDAQPERARLSCPAVKLVVRESRNSTRRRARQQRSGIGEFVDTPADALVQERKAGAA
jgi:hypothetical protein